MGHVDNVDNQFQVARPRSPRSCALPGVDNVDNLFLIVHIVHIFFCASLFLFAWEFPARGFVGQVDNVDARFKLVPDEVST